MFISKKNQELVLNLGTPSRVTSVIPESRVVQHKGENFVFVPHTIDEVRTLRTLGFDAPSPISSYYEWAGDYEPFAHQRITAEELVLNPRMFCLNGMGSGKTLSVLWAYDWLRQIGAVRSMLVIAPLSTLERVWGDEIYKHFPHLSFTVLHGTREKRHRLIKEKHDIYIINHDGIKKDATVKALQAQTRIDLVVVDEVASFRNTTTDRWKYTNRLINGFIKDGSRPKTWAWGLTGTPIPKDAADAYGQVKLINPHKLGMSFTRFRETVMRPVGMRWENRPEALDHVHKLMQPAVRFSTQDCIDLPPTTHTVREVEMGTEQKKAYGEMLRTLYTEYEGGEITASNEAVKLTKLLQICCGAAYSNDSDGVVLLPAEKRIAEVKALIEQAEGKAIVFVPFTAPLHRLAEVLRKDYSVEVVDGGVSKAKRDEVFHKFQNTDHPQVLVANAGTMAHGLTLTAASLIIWYALPHSLEVFEQANARIPRPGQKLHTVIASIVSSPVEEKIYEKLRVRGKTQGILLDLFGKKH